jgi:hypothetical protein
MPTTRPGFIWSGTEWVAIGQEAIVNPFYYQATAPTTPSTGDIWIESDVDVPSVDSAQFLRWRKTMAGGETSLSGNDDSSLPLGYTPGYEQLYINGVLMVRGVDYTATTGTTVTALTALVANDVVEIFSALARTVADVYTQTQSDARFVNQVNNGMFLVKPIGATNGTVGANGAVTVGTAVSSVTVSGAFSATYDNYKILYTGGTTSATSQINMTLGATTSGYSNVLVYGNYTNTTVSAVNTNAGSSWSYIGYGNTNTALVECELYQPFLTKNTFFSSNHVQGGGAASAGGKNSGVLIDSTSYTSFTLTAISGTLTGGTIKIYGYNNGA